jgi:hypothetical protein
MRLFEHHTPIDAISTPSAASVWELSWSIRLINAALGPPVPLAKTARPSALIRCPQDGALTLVNGLTFSQAALIR